jgi:hypothetical protein
MGLVEHGPKFGVLVGFVFNTSIYNMKFYFGVLTLSDFAYNSFVCNILACQMEGPTYCMDLLLL